MQNSFLHWIVNVCFNHQILRVDIVEDCGRSLSPCIDVGQIEGAFVMGLGFYTSEQVKFDKETGQKLSKGTWVSSLV